MNEEMDNLVEQVEESREIQGTVENLAGWGEWEVFVSVMAFFSVQNFIQEIAEGQAVRILLTRTCQIHVPNTQRDIRSILRTLAWNETNFL